jgi:hypothetical protein
VCFVMGLIYPYLGMQIFLLIPVLVAVGVLFGYGIEVFFIPVYVIC